MAKRIPDEEVIKHFKKRLLDKIPLKKKRDLRVVAVKPPKTPTGDFVIEELKLEEIYQHMLKKDEIGRQHIKIERHWMREAKKRELE